MPSKAQLFDYWKDKEVIVDWGEPECWACGRWWEDKYDISNSDASMKEIRKIWNDVPLQRCHIVPVSLGGSNHPSNIFLMCPDCHNQQPNTKSREAFLRWAKAQEFARRVEITFAEFQFSEPETQKVLDVLCLRKCGTTLQKYRIEHFFQHNIGSHWLQGSGGGMITISSLIAAAFAFPDERLEKVMALDNAWTNKRLEPKLRFLKHVLF
jgi:HNH endonuclease